MARAGPIIERGEWSFESLFLRNLPENMELEAVLCIDKKRLCP